MRTIHLLVKLYQMLGKIGTLPSQQRGRENDPQNSVESAREGV